MILKTQSDQLSLQAYCNISCTIWVAQMGGRTLNLQVNLPLIGFIRVIIVHWCSNATVAAWPILLFRINTPPCKPPYLPLYFIFDKYISSRELHNTICTVLRASPTQIIIWFLLVYRVQDDSVVQDL